MPKRAPVSPPPHLIITLFYATWILFSLNTPCARAYEGLEHYYIRYDVKTVANAFSDDHLLMIPAKNDFRAENFSQYPVSGVISAAHNGTQASITQLIKEDALKIILTQKGLKSLKSMDLDTIVSYEGAIITPINIIKSIYNEEEHSYHYSVTIHFSPLAFPDKWETLGLIHKVKSVIHTFFDFFN